MLDQRPIAASSRHAAGGAEVTGAAPSTPVHVAEGIEAADNPCPDAELLALCDRLREMQARWQRPYDTTSDSGPLTTPADFAWPINVIAEHAPSKEKQEMLT